MVVVMFAMRMLEMTVVQIIRVATMDHDEVAAARTANMRVLPIVG